MDTKEDSSDNGMQEAGKELLDNHDRNKAQESKWLEQVKDLEAQLKREETKSTRALVVQSNLESDMIQMKTKVIPGNKSLIFSL